MSKTQTKAGSLNKQVTPEDAEAQAKRFLMSKREAVAQMCLSSLCQNPSATIDLPLVEKAFTLAEDFVKRAYGYHIEFVQDTQPDA